MLPSSSAAMHNRRGGVGGDSSSTVKFAKEKSEAQRNLGYHAVRIAAIPSILRRKLLADSRRTKFLLGSLISLVLTLGILRQTPRPSFESSASFLAPTSSNNGTTPPALSSHFPREPLLTPGCSVKFRHTNTSLCYFLPYGANFGDELGPAAVKRILEYHFGCSSSDVHVIDMAPNTARRNNRTCLFALGSIFHYVRAGDHVWGTGINPSHQGPHPSWLNIHAVRGPETERKMKEWYGYESVPHVDPGFLIPFLYQDYYHLPTKSVGVEPAYTTPHFCFVPHAQDLQLEEIVHAPKDLEIISVKQHWQPMMESIRHCDYLVSTSLHGIIIADALGIPSKWFQFNASKTEKTEGNFKYRDYLWSIGRTSVTEPEREFGMAQFKKTSSYMKPLSLETRREIVTRFLSSFPLQLFRKSLLPNESTKIKDDCIVTFQNPKMALCVNEGGDSGGFVGDIGVDVVKRLLENRFGCSARKIPVVRVTQREDETICLLAQGNLLKFAKKGDHVWGSGTSESKKMKLSDATLHSVRGPTSEAALKKRITSSGRLSYGDPAFLFPYLHREHLLSERRPPTDPPRFCYIPHERDDEDQVSKDLDSLVGFVSLQLSLAEAVQSLQKCDRVTSSSVTGLILADSLGIPTKWMQRRGTNLPAIEVEDYFKSTQRTLPRLTSTAEEPLLIISDAQGYVEPLSLDDRERFADETAASFPFHLFDTNQNKTLVIVMGNIRGGELAWRSMYRHVLDVNSADLALVVGQVPKDKRNSSLYERAKYLYEFPEFDDWADAIDQINGTSWREDLLAYVSKTHGLFGGAKGYTGSGAVIFMARWYVSKAFEKYGWKDRYDRFVLTRADHYYGCSHDLSLLDPAFLWVPTGEEFGGVTDRHLVCNRGQILKAIDIYPNAVRHPTKYVDNIWFERNPEQMIARRWKEENLWDDVRRFDRVMFTCAEAGDETRWQVKSEKRSKEGVFLKYVTEYNQTNCVCSGKSWNMDEKTCVQRNNIKGAT